MLNKKNINFKAVLKLIGVFCLFKTLNSFAGIKENNPPYWPEDSVLIFSEEDRNISEIIKQRSSLLNNRHTGHFSSDRLAIMFKPGTYKESIEVGYYMQVLGLGEEPNDVVFAKDPSQNIHGVFCNAMDPRKFGAGSLDTFWRSAENFYQSHNLKWAVSQAAPLRRIVVEKDLILHDKGRFASGGFMANMKIGGHLRMGSQQQWITRNSEMSPSSYKKMGGAWNLVFVGSKGNPRGVKNPENTQTNCAHTVEEQTPMVIEKPFITLSKNGRYFLQVPGLKINSEGVDYSIKGANHQSIDFENVYVARPLNELDFIEQGERITKDSLVDLIQSKIDAGLHIVFTPGIYHLSKPLVVKHSNQVLLGLGLATLIAPKTKEPCIHVLGSTQGVKVAGLMLESSEEQTDQNQEGVQTTLLLWGDAHLKNQGNVNNPGLISDVFIRVGGSQILDSSVDTMIHIYASYVIGDNLWLWRADHTKLRPGEEARQHHSIKGAREDYHLVTKGEYRVNNGLVVDGDDVTIYGLAVEHTTQDGVLWNANRGKTYFYQCELPYDVDQKSFGDLGYVGYRVSSFVEEHSLKGAGVYSFFRDFPCLVDSAFVLPENKNLIRYENIFTRYLNGFGGILHVLNHKGSSVGSLMSRLP